MPTFSYASVDATGRAKQGVIEAPDQKSAVAKAAAEGRYITSISEQTSSTPRAESNEPKKKSGRPSRGDIALFTRRLADLSSSGLPLDRVLAVLVEQTENQALSDAVRDALIDVQGGLPLSAAFAKNPKYFPEVYTMTVKAGEASGMLPESCERLADMLERDVATRSQIISAMIYPAILSATAVFVIVFLMTFVVPKLSSVFDSLGDSLPFTTKLLLASSRFLTSDWYIVVGGVAVIAVVSRIYLSTSAGQLARDKFLLKAPIIGPVVQKATISRYARVLGTLTFGGVPILEALELAGLAAGNRVFKDSTQFVEDEVREGRSIGVAMKDAHVFPPVLTHMVAIGEETGDLSKMLDRVASSLDFEVSTALKRLTAAVEPVIVLIMGGIVAMIVISVMLPIIQAQDLVK